MLRFAARSEHAKAVHIGVGSHNLFDIAYAMLLRSERNIGGLFSFEMLEGMADHMRRAVQEVSGQMLLYAPAKFCPLPCLVNLLFGLSLCFYLRLSCQ